MERQLVPTGTKKKHKNIIIAELKDTWPGIIINQRLKKDRKVNNRHRKNLKNRF